MNSSGQSRTGDLSIMSGALLPTELRCQKSGGLVPTVVPSSTEKPGTSSVSETEPRHYECRSTVSACQTHSNRSSGKARIGTGGGGGFGAAYGAKDRKAPGGRGSTIRRRGKRSRKRERGTSPTQARKQRAAEFMALLHFAQLLPSAALVFHAASITAPRGPAGSVR